MCGQFTVQWVDSGQCSGFVDSAVHCSALQCKHVLPLWGGLLEGGRSGQVGAAGQCQFPEIGREGGGARAGTTVLSLWPCKTLGPGKTGLVQLPGPGGPDS